MENKDKVVWITGASSGIGKAISKLLLEYGYVVYASARKKEKLLDLKRLGAHIMQMDITKNGDMQNGIDEIIANEGRIDILINNTRFGLLEMVEGAPILEAKYQFDVNVFGLAQLSQLVLPYMKREKSGKIVMISSIYSNRNVELSGWYNSSRYALEAISSSIRKAAKPFGIDVILSEKGVGKSQRNTVAAETLQKISEGKGYSKMAEQFWHWQS
ncbi:MAG: SDR family NAD(P)-dependent oxidoreductase [Flavobacterium sp.]|nr:SDR family NAD(P)-dependent oxidoreductase [Flavobacterium sp.]